MRSKCGRITVGEVEVGGPVFHFPPFLLDLASGQLRRGAEVIPLRPKSFAVLRYLVEHAGQLITKDALLEAVWPDTVVTEALVKDSIFELRRTLGDAAKAARVIETVHRRGYRFIAPLSGPSPVASSRFQVPSSSPSLASRPQHPTLNLVGRAAELEQLHRWLGEAMSGARQIVFVTGEPGIGKTTLVDAFLHPFAEQELWIGRGQCIEQYGAGEAYMPILDAFGRLCRAPGGERLIALLSQHAPTWLVQMPTLLNVTAWEALQRKVQGATRERMLRELGEAVDALTAERPLVLWLEDLHWSDGSTVELLALLARRREPARVLVVGTYRPVEMLMREHRLRAVKQELQLHGLCKELPLGLLSEQHVAEYLEARFDTGGGPRHAVPLPQLAHVIHERTEGNPLFMVTVVDMVILHGALVLAEGQWTPKGPVASMAAGVPETLRQMIERQLEQLSAEDQCVAEVASVAGTAFSAAAVAAGVEAEIATIERQCATLARRGQLLQASGLAEWPDGTVAARYEFLHALYQEVMYERVTASRRVELHRRIGERAEQAYGDRAREIAAELAVHFERGREYRKAVQYLLQAGENATQRSAHQEAITLLTKGLVLLPRLPNTPARAHQELSLQVALALPLMLTKGLAAPEVGAVHTRALALCQQIGETPQLFPALWGAQVFYLTRAELQTARALAERLLSLAQREQDSALLLGVHYWSGSVLHALGELIAARAHFEHALSVYHLRQRGSFIARYGADLGVTSLALLALVLWLLGYPDQARKRNRQALSLAQEIDNPWNTALVWSMNLVLHQCLHEAPAVQQQAEALGVLSNEQGFSSFWAGTSRHGWALVMQGQEAEGLQEMHQGLVAVRATGMELYRSYDLALLAEACQEAGRVENGLTALAEALAVVDRTGERFWEAELHRLKGELTLQQTGFRLQAVGVREKTEKAEACFWKAIDLARRQQAKSLELRGVMSLARLWQQQGKKDKARQMLADIYGWFTEGFDTVDLKEARTLLNELS